MKRILQITILISLILLCSPAWAVVYHIRDDGTDGGANDGTTDAKAWLTITYALGQMSGGDDLYFKCDDTWTEDFEPASAIGGTSGNRTIFGAYHGNGTIGVSGAKPIINGPTGSGYALRLLGQTYSLDYITITNLQLRAGTSCILIREAEYTIIENCVIGDGTTTFGIYVRNSDHSIFRYNTIDSDYTAQGSLNDGILITETSDSCEIYGNAIKDWGHSGINLYNSDSCSVYENYVSGPNSTNMRGFETGAGSNNNTIERNYFYDLTVHSQMNNGGTGNIVRNNIFDTMRTNTDVSERHFFQLYTGGSAVGHVTGNYLVNNVFYDNFGSGIQFYDTSGSYNVYDNYIGNNIIIDAGDYGIEKTSQAGDQYFYNNQVYNSTTADFRVGSTNYTAATFNAIGARYADNLDSDPGLSNPAGSEFWPDAATDTCVNAGYTFANVTEGLKYDSTWTPTISINTVVRADHGGHDIGPYEYISGSEEPPLMTLMCKFDNGALLREEITDNDTYWTDNGTVQQSATCKQGDRSAYFVDANVEYLTRAGTVDDFGIGTNGEFTICFWARPTILSDQGLLMQKGGSGTNDAAYGIQIRADDTVRVSVGYGANSDNWEYLDHNNALTVNQWYWICWGHNVSTKANLIHIYDDTAGAVLGTDYTTASTNAMTGHNKAGDISVGANPLGVAPSDSLIDKMVVYDRKLSAAEITAARTENWDSSTLTNSTAPAATYSTNGDTVTVTITTSVEAFVENGIPYGTLETGYNDAIAYYTGKTSTTQTYVATLTTGMRTTDLVWKDANITLPTGCTMKNAVGDAFTLTLPDAGAITNTTVVAIVSTATNPITVGSGADIAKISDMSHLLNTDVYQYLEPITDNVDLTGFDGIIISGIGRTQVNTGTLILGTNCHVRCVNFSGAVTGAGANGNTYHPICTRGASRMGMGCR